MSVDIEIIADEDELDRILRYVVRNSDDAKQLRALIEFQDFQEQMYVQNVKLDSLVNVGELLVSSERENKTVTISFTGDEQCPGETITLVVTYDNEEFRYNVKPTDDNTITLNSDITSLFSGKEVGVKILRTKNIKLNNVSPAGGDLLLVYTSRERRVKL